MFLTYYQLEGRISKSVFRNLVPVVAVVILSIVHREAHGKQRLGLSKPPKQGESKKDSNMVTSPLDLEIKRELIAQTLLLVFPSPAQLQLALWNKCLLRLNNCGGFKALMEGGRLHNLRLSRLKADKGRGPWAQTHWARPFPGPWSGPLGLSSSMGEARAHGPSGQAPTLVHGPRPIGRMGSAHVGSLEGN